MFLQSVATRVAVMITVLMIGVTGIAYGVGHLSDAPLFMAYVDQSQSNDRTLYAYFVDPIRRLSVPIEVPTELASSAYFTVSNEPYHIFMSKNGIDETGTNVRGLYRYNFRTQDITSVYETEFGDHVPSTADHAFEFNGYSDLEHYIIADKSRHAIVTVNRQTLDQHVLWQGANRSDQSLDYTLSVSSSPSGDKYAILDSSRSPGVVVVSQSGEIISQFQTIDASQYFVVWLDDQLLMVTQAGVRNQLTTEFGIYDTNTGEANRFTESLSVADAQPIIGCEMQDPWIGYIQSADNYLFQAFTMNLATGTTYDQGTFGTLSVFFGQPPLPPSYGCTLQLPLLTYDEEMFDLYLSSLTGDGLEQILSDIFPGQFIDDDTFTYAKQNESSSYDIYALSFDDFTARQLLTDLPTKHAVWSTKLLDRGWYLFLDNQWLRPEVFRVLAGNPLLYYDVHSNDVDVLTPPDVRIVWFNQVP